MKNLLRYALITSSLMLASCASNIPLTHDYKGSIHVRSLYVNFQSMKDARAGDPEDVFALINQAQRLIQNIDDLLNPNKNERLFKQLLDFQSTLVAGIRRSTGLPVVTPEQVDVNMVYNDADELTDIEFTYPDIHGPALDMQAYINYTESSSLYIGTEEANAQQLTVKPQLVLDVQGQNRKGEYFWRHSYRYDSNNEYTLANDYFLGVSTSRIDDGQIFLIPLAEGLLSVIPRIN
ncbi:hypothetical protein A9Q99_10495 [Gammaproteobacteria bacterium 45_16_T64]|nr:hypothetical protein A9Q99_10495 [Gammaproteobacteria bacterium 45_16_T64]